MWLITHEDALAAPHTLALLCGAAPLVRPSPHPWAAGPTLASGRHRDDGALAPRTGLRQPVPSTAAPARPSFHRDRPGWPAGDETHGGKAVPGGPRARGALSRRTAGVLTVVPTVSPLRVSLWFGWFLAHTLLPQLPQHPTRGKPDLRPQRCRWPARWNGHFLFFG